MAKAKRGLLLSLFTLVMAVAVTVTSTYAWFVVNKEVTASNMQVTVASDTTYLVISDSSTLSTGTTLALTAANPNAVLPVRYNPSGTGATKWETAAGTSYTNGTALNNTYTAVASADVGKHTVLYTFYVGLTDTTALNASNLRVKSLSVSENGTAAQNTFRPAISAMVECVQATETIDNCVNFANITSISDFDVETTPGTRDYAVLASTVTKGVVYTINVYVYVNGDNAAVKSENAANVAGFTVSLTLQVTPGTPS